MGVDQKSHLRTNHGRGGRALIRKVRRALRAKANACLAKFVGTVEPRSAELASDTQKILVIRLNKRLGNTLFITPMLESLAAGLPQADIDVLVRHADHQALLNSLPSVRQVFVQETKPGKLIKQLLQLRKVHYDLVIDPVTRSSSNRLAMTLIYSRQKLGFADQDQWVKLTHAAELPKSEKQAERCVELLQTATQGINFPSVKHLAVYPSANDQLWAKETLENAFGANYFEQPIVGFFSRATGAKMLPRVWWQHFVEVIRKQAPNIQLIEVLPAADAASVIADIHTVHQRSLLRLAALMRQLDQFVAADGGPMHLAAAAGTPVIGLFVKTSPDQYGPFNECSISFSNQQVDPELVAQRVISRVAR